MTKLITDATGCPVNRFTFVTSNAKWIADAKTWKSGATRQRNATSHVLNHNELASDLGQAIINDIYEAVEACENGINL